MPNVNDEVTAASPPPDMPVDPTREENAELRDEVEDLRERRQELINERERQAREANGQSRRRSLEVERKRLLAEIADLEGQEAVDVAEIPETGDVAPLPEPRRLITETPADSVDSSTVRPVDPEDPEPAPEAVKPEEQNR